MIRSLFLLLAILMIAPGCGSSAKGPMDEAEVVPADPEKIRAEKMKSMEMYKKRGARIPDELKEKK